jgi:hypothetical protein
MLTDRILRSALIAISTWLAGTQLAAAGIIPNPNASPTPTIPPIISGTPTPTPPPTPNPAILLRADPQLARAVVRYGQNATLSLANDRGRFQKVALQPDEVVTVLLTLSPPDYGKPAAVELLDGGAMTTSVSVPKPKDILPPTPTPFPTGSPPNGPSSSGSPTPPMPVITPPPVPNATDLIDTGALMTVSQAGELLFSFKPGNDIGLHRVSVVVDGNQYFFQFWRQDMNAQNTNPRMLRAY